MKTKLINVRKDKHFTQSDMATCLKISPTHYQRKERGEVKIFDDEWEQIAKLLSVPVEDIKEEEKENVINHSFDNVSGNYNYIGSNNNYCNVPEYLLDNQQNYINMLLEKITELENQVVSLQQI
ncbi:MAG: helix-turn-helix domain-containing protein [Prevotellaceae bacterium]|jgi:DNA-binding XRE family transcriptional regulator|nr:helix-turn-helix domain-containing protein [Prevotellaceae bacterium]